MNLLHALLIGNGTMGKRHRARFERDGVLFDKVLDVDAEKWIQKQATWNNAQVGASEKIDFVVVASPASTHYKYVKFLLERRVPVMVEKPLALSSLQAKELVELSKKNETLLFVAQSECYNPLFLSFRKRFMKELNGLRVGGASSQVGCAGVRMEFRREHGHSERCRDVDVSKDLLVHDLSLFLNLFPLNDVRVVSRNLQSDEASMQLQIVSGLYESLVADFYVNRESPRDLRTITVSLSNEDNSLTDYFVSLVRYASNGNVVHIPDALDNEHRFFLKLLAGECKGWADRAMLNAAQAITLIDF